MAGKLAIVEKLGNVFRVPDLRKRVLFTLAMLAVYRLGSHIPTPGVNADRLKQMFEQSGGGLLNFYDLFSGGNLKRFTIFALGIMPYITSSIILQLLTVVYEPLARLQKEGELGRRKITQWTRYLTFILSAVQSLGIAYGMQSQQGLVANPGIGFILMTMITLTTGSVFIMWLGEQITERGIGNGMSLLIFSGIVVGLPRAIRDLYTKFAQQAFGPFTVPILILLVVGMIAVVAFIVFMERSERRIPVQYAKRVVGRRVMGGQSTHLPLRVNSGGVMPVIFASSLLSIPQMLTQVPAFKSGGTMHRYFGPLLDQLRWGEPLYTLLYAVGIIFFAYFYVSIVFNPSDVADNMRKYGGFIPGIRPGHRTRDYINEVLTRVTLVGALYLILISLIPEWMIAGIHLNHLPWWLGGGMFERLPNAILNGLGVNFYFGGTSLLIVVGVAMDTVNQIESQLVMRHYEGFTSKKGLIKGRGRSW
jgi:preprotein translocase subunit SecY